MFIIKYFYLFACRLTACGFLLLFARYKFPIVQREWNAHINYSEFIFCCRDFFCPAENLTNSKSKATIYSNTFFFSVWVYLFVCVAFVGQLCVSSVINFCGKSNRARTLLVFALPFGYVWSEWLWIDIWSTTSPVHLSDIQLIFAQFSHLIFICVACARATRQNG